MAHVSKKWAGLGKEMFTSADNYMLEISNDVPQNDDVRKLILAAVMCIDMVLKEWRWIYNSSTTAELM